MIHHAARIPVLWRDRTGRFSALKASVLALAFVPLLWLIWRWYSDDLGARPLNEAIHETGRWAVRILLVALAVSPARTVFAWSRVMLVRRMIGLTALSYGLLHLGLYAYDQGFAPLRIVSEIAIRFYLTIGFLALCGLAALGVTSTDQSMRRMGRNWKRLQRLAYPIGALALVHAFLQSKLDVNPSLLLEGMFFWLMIWRLMSPVHQRAPVSLALLAVGAGLATVAASCAWYGLVTHISALRVLDAHLDFARRIQPAWYVLAAGLAVAAVSAWRHRQATPPQRGGAQRGDALRGGAQRGTAPARVRTAPSPRP